MSKDYLDSVRDGLGLMGRMAAKGMGKLSEQLKSDDREEKPPYETGLYFQKHIVTKFGDLVPGIEYHEPVELSSLGGTFLKKFKRSQADRSFISACYDLLYGETERASGKLDKTLATDPQYSDAYYLKGLLYIQKENFEKAEENFSRCRLLPMGLGSRLTRFMPSLKSSIILTENLTFSFYPDVVGLNLLLAISQRNGKKLSLAIQTLEQILAVMPDNAELLMFLAMFYHEAGWSNKIVERFKDIIPDNDLGVIITQFLIMAWIERKNYTLAEGVLQKALETAEIDPYLRADIRMLLGEALSKAGKNAEGSAQVNKVKKKYPEYRNIVSRMGLDKASSPISEPEQAPPPLPQTLEKEIKKLTDTEEWDTAATKSMESEYEFKEPEEPKQPETQPSGDTAVRLVSEDGKINTPIRDEIVIGREEGDVVVHWDSSASRKHARIFRTNGQILVEDLGSTNGTWITRHKVKEQRVFNRGDMLLVGNTEFHLEQD
jgi:tetratricopeptide (TPR) repeat protein